MIIWSSINFPIVICSPTVEYLCSLEKPIVKPMAPGSSFSYICLAIYFSFAFLFRSIKPKNTKIPCCVLSLFILFGVRSINLLQFYLTSVCLSWGAATRKGLTTPFTRRVPSSCYLCAGAVYVVLLGSPTGSIPWFHNSGKYSTVTVLHHPSLSREIPM